MTLDIQALLKDENLLRQEAERWLNPGSWKHGGIPTSDGEREFLECQKCGARYYAYSEEGFIDAEGRRLPHCSIPDPATGPLEVIAERLLSIVTERENGDYRLRSRAYWFIKEHRIIGGNSEVWWFAFHATPAERIACCLLALEQKEERR